MWERVGERRKIGGKMKEGKGEITRKTSEKGDRVKEIKKRWDNGQKMGEWGFVWGNGEGK